MNLSNFISGVAAPTSILLFFSLIKFSSSISCKLIILLISFFSLVTINDKSVPPLKKWELEFFLITFFNSLIVLGEKYFLPLFSIEIFFKFIFFKSLMIFFLFFLNWSVLSILFKLFAASMIGL